MYLLFTPPCIVFFSILSQIELLEGLVAEEEANPTGSFGGGINWVVVSKHLNRKTVDCKRKWRSIHNAMLKKGK